MTASAGIQAGALDRRVTLYKPMTVPGDLARETRWTKLGKVWGSRAAAGATRRLAAAQVQATVTHVFVIRWSGQVADLKPGWALFCDGVWHQVVSVAELGRREALSIEAAAAADAPKGVEVA